ncbi:AAA family ATPase [Shewanella algae]|uniref:nucleotide-binding protein n=1 Tax=Shewanella algae TaxID=38313 RepID=UPI0030043ECD
MTVHIIAQGKGGVGKTTISVFLSQYLKDNSEREIICIDTDPVNSTFSAFKSLEVNQIKLIDENDDINSRNFDALIEMIAESRDSNFVIDVGASSFVPMANYILQNEVIDILTSLGHETIIHTIVTGGPSLLDTLNGMNQLLTTFPDEAKFIVWLNPFFGNIESNGKTFEAMKAYIQNKDRIASIIRIPKLKPETFGKDLQEMLSKHKTFSEAIPECTETGKIMVAQRLKIVSTDIFQQISQSKIWSDIRNA